MQEEPTVSELVDDVRTGRMDRRTLIKRLMLMGLSAAGVGAVAAVATQHMTSRVTALPANRNNYLREHLEQHQQHLANQATGNLQQLEQDYHEDAIVEDSMFSQPFVGRKAIMARKSAGFAAIPDVNITVTRRIVRGNQLTVEWIASGTHWHDYPGMPATGRLFSIPGVTVVVRRDGKIVRESLYYDMTEVLRQLGGRRP